MFVMLRNQMRKRSKTMGFALVLLLFSMLTTTSAMGAMGNLMSSVSVSMESGTGHVSDAVCAGDREAQLGHHGVCGSCIMCVFVVPPNVAMSIDTAPVAFTPEFYVPAIGHYQTLFKPPKSTSL